MSIRFERIEYLSHRYGTEAASFNEEIEYIFMDFGLEIMARNVRKMGDDLSQQITSQL